MRNWPKWIPSRNSWMSAILLILLMRGISEIVQLIIGMGDFLASFSPRLKLILYVAALLSPIPVIALTHHYLHRFLDRFFPDTSTVEMEEVQGIFPSLMSWWEGLFGWQTIAILTLVSSLTQLLLLPSVSHFSYNFFHHAFGVWDEIREFFKLPNLIRIITAAYLYQFEHLVRQHLIAVGARIRVNRS